MANNYGDSTQLESTSSLSHLGSSNTDGIDVEVPKWVPIRETIMINIRVKDHHNHTVTVQAQLKAGNTISVPLRDNQDGSFTASFVASHLGEMKLLIFNNDKHIEGSPFSVLAVRHYCTLDKPSKIVENDERMGKPLGIAFGKDGLWAVVHLANNCICVYDDQDELIRNFGSFGGRDSQFIHPIALAFDAMNNLYVVETINCTVQKFDINGSCLLQFGKRGFGSGELNDPSGITVHNDRVLVADQENSRISVFQTDGQFSHTFGSGQLRHPWDVAIANSNRIVVADRGYHCISIFTLDGNYVSKIGGTKGIARGQLSRPSGLAVDFCGFIFVTDYNNHRVTVFDNDGVFVHCFGSGGSGAGQFLAPYKIACSPNGSVYVSDHSNKRIQIFSDY